LVNIKDQYSGLKQNFLLYCRLYGGFRALLASPYLHFALAISFVSGPVWSGRHTSWAWFDLCISVLPGILVFSLLGWVAFLFLGNSGFVKTIAGKDPEEGGDESPFLHINGVFLHSMLVQAAALLFSVVSAAKGLNAGVAAFAGFFLFLYALSLSVAVAFAILRLAFWYDIFVGKEAARREDAHGKHD
jgi:hypothetical protein